VPVVWIALGVASGPQAHADGQDAFWQGFAFLLAAQGWCVSSLMAAGRTVLPLPVDRGSSLGREPRREAVDSQQSPDTTFPLNCGNH
jgi:hypothetical protein